MTNSVLGYLRRANHLDSGGLLLALLLLVVVLMAPHLGWHFNWTPKTTPYRLTQDPFAGWALAAVIALGLVSVRKGDERRQCMTALILFGLLCGFSLASGLFWDPWLGSLLIGAALPMLAAARRGLDAAANSRDSSSRRGCVTKD